jgi:DNA-binding MarR family transcriptional regulator
MPPKSRRPTLRPEHYETLAAFRYALRKFLQFSATAAEAAGLPPQQHQALLAIKGYPGRDRVTIGELAERLQVRHHSAVGLVDRLVQRKLVRRLPASEDRRRVLVALTPAGEAVLERLSQAHVHELKQMGPELRRLLEMTERE